MMEVQADPMSKIRTMELMIIKDKDEYQKLLD